MILLEMMDSNADAVRRGSRRRLGLLAVLALSFILTGCHAWRDGDVLSRTPVTTGRHVGELVVITSGLDAGERVVVRDVAALSDGMQVGAVQAGKTAGP